jgi:hypothetical protein
MDYDVEFSKLKNFKQKQNEQKQRGLNNYNILTAVLKDHDEVRLHSRMLFSFLDPHGEHFQGTLFLDKFFEVIGLKELGFRANSENCSVYIEYENIDLYITDGDKHIIIENKIYAGDQEKQIARYLDVIQAKDRTLSENNILIIYLTLDSREPSQCSLDNLIINNRYLESSGEKQAIYKSIGYKYEIIEWIKLCQHEVQNITNLNSAFNDYKDVIDMLNNNYKEKIMSIVEYIQNNKSAYELAIELQNNLPKAQEAISISFFKKLRNELSIMLNELSIMLGDEWVIDEIDPDFSMKGKFVYPIKIYKEKWRSNKKFFSFLYAIENERHFIGISPESSDNLHVKNDISSKYSEEISKVRQECTANNGWLFYEYVCMGERYCNDFNHFVHFETKAGENIAKQIMKIIKDFEVDSSLMSTINNREGAQLE